MTANANANRSTPAGVARLGFAFTRSSPNTQRGVLGRPADQASRHLSRAVPEHRIRRPIGAQARRNLRAEGRGGIDEHSRFCIAAGVVTRATSKAECVVLSAALRSPTATGCGTQLLPKFGRSA